MTHFNTPKNEMSLKVLLVIGNGFLIPIWKYEIWISKNDSILRTTVWKGIDYSSIQSCVWACHLVSVRKILTSLLDKCNRMTEVQPHFPAMSWNDANLKCTLQVVYQLWNIDFGEHQKNLPLLFSDLQCYAITICFSDLVAKT